MSRQIMVNKGLSLRRALSAIGSSQGAYYYNNPISERSDKVEFKDPAILSKIRELASQKPTYGTRMMAALLSRELKRSVSRKLGQHAYRNMGWIVPF